MATLGLGLGLVFITVFRSIFIYTYIYRFIFSLGSSQSEDEFPTDSHFLPSQFRSKIELRPQPVSTQGAATRDSLLPGARTSSLFLNGTVKPVSIEPLFEAIDEMKYGGKW